MNFIRCRPDRIQALALCIMGLLLICGWFLFFHSSNSRCPKSEWLRDRLIETELVWAAGVSKRHAMELEKPNIFENPYNGLSLLLIWDFFYTTFNCPHLNERIGRVGDGGKWVCGVSHLAKLPNSCLIYSYGIAGDSSFEEEILNRTACILRAFDQTVSPGDVSLVEKYPNRSSFYQIGLGAKNGGNYRTLKSEMNLHGDKFIDILKVDVEGGEFELIPQILKDFPDGLPFGQLLIEIHLGSLPQEKLYAGLKSWWESLENAGLRPFNSEPNFYILYMGVHNPSNFEISFLNAKGNHTLLHM